MAVTEANQRPGQEKRSTVHLRLQPSVLRDIDQRAQALRLTRTEYMIRTALGEPLQPNSTDQRLDQHDQRITRLEELAYNS